MPPGGLLIRRWRDENEDDTPLITPAALSVDDRVYLVVIDIFAEMTMHRRRQQQQQ